MRSSISASVLVLAFVLFACSRSEAPPAPPEEPAALPGVGAKPPPGPSAAATARTAARVASVELGSALDATRRVVGPKTAFAPTETIYASVATQGWEGPVTLTARWTYEDGQVVNESSQTAQAGPSTTEFHIAKPGGWPAGTYQVEILADGATAATQRFEVR
jgi:hypothetical protein